MAAARMPSAAEGSVFRRGFFAAARVGAALGLVGTRLEITPVRALFGFGFDAIDVAMVFFLYSIFIKICYFIGFSA
jgi:hypothetical protein